MQRLNRFTSASVLYLTVFGCTLRAVADPLTFYFEGYVDFIHDFLELDDSVFVGAKFVGTYSFDPTGVPDLYPENPTVGAYYFGTDGWLSAHIGNYEFTSSDLGMLIWNDRVSGDVYGVANSAPFSAAGYQWQAIEILLVDSTRSALDSDALVTSVPDLSAFQTFHGLVLDFPGDTLAIRGVLTSLTPEPASFVLLVLGAAALARRQRSS